MTAAGVVLAIWSPREKGGRRRREGGWVHSERNMNKTTCISVQIFLSRICLLKVLAHLKLRFLKLLQPRLMIQEFFTVLGDVQNLSHVILEGLWITCGISFSNVLFFGL